MNTMILSATKTSDAMALGLALSVCSLAGWELGIMYNPNVRAVEGRPDLRVINGKGGTRFEALTEDGQAFLDLLSEAA